MKHIANFQIHDAFYITERGILLNGIILDGEFATDHFISFSFNKKQLKRKIKGISQVLAKKDKLFTGILIENYNEEEIIDFKNWNPNKTISKIYSIE